MKSNCVMSLMAFTMLFVTESVMLAQPQPPAAPSRPAFSPYLNLINRGGGAGNAAINYYGIVRPQQQMMQQFGQVQQELGQANQNLQTLTDSVNTPATSPFAVDTRLRTTGFVPLFNNTGRYFNSHPIGGGGGGGARAGGGMSMSSVPRPMPGGASGGGARAGGGRIGGPAMTGIRR